MWFGRVDGPEVASDLAGAIARFEQKSEEVVAAARSDVADVAQLVAERHAYWLAELARRQQALLMCQAAAAETGADCSSYAVARDVAQANVDTVAALVERVGDASSGLDAAASRYQQELASTCPAARADLLQHSSNVAWWQQ